MWILPKDLIQSHSLPVMEELSEVLKLQENESITLPFVKSKPMPSRTLSTRWKQGHWIAALYGRMLKPSQGNNFLEKWTSLQEDSHANPSPVRETEKVTKTQDTSGLPVSEPLSPSNPLGSFSRMLKELLAPSSEEKDGQTPKEHLYCSMSLENWKGEVTKHRGEYSLRVKQAHRIREKESLSMGNWQTPTVVMPDETQENFLRRKKERGFKNGTQVPHLLCQVKTEAMKNWPTPNTMDALPQRSEEALIRQATTTRKGRKSPANLREMVNPRAVEIYSKCNGPQDPGNHNTNGKLPESWPTPQARDFKDGEPLDKWSKRAEKQKEKGVNLHLPLNYKVIHEVEKSWPTPSVSGIQPNTGREVIETDSGFAAVSNTTGVRYGAKLEDVAVLKEKEMQWPTPAQRDYKDSPGTSMVGKKGFDRSKSTMPLAVFTEEGVRGDEKWKSLKLNPDWVEQLMGLPLGWTDSDRDFENRVDRLRLLGNGVVPTTAAVAWKLLSKRGKM